MAWLPLRNYRNSLRCTSSVYRNTNFSTGIRGKLLHPISSQEERWFPVFDWRLETTFHQHLKWSFPSAIVMWEGPCVSCLKWNGPRRPWLKEGRNSLQWLKFRLVFYLTRWSDVWIPCGDPRESHRSPPHLDRGNHITLIPREAHRIQGFKRWRWLIFENG